jgi:hypothetical protein
VDLEEKEYLLTLSVPELVEMISDLNDDIHFRTFIPNPKLRELYGTYSPAELARRLEICERVRKHWRILAIGAALGVYGVEALKAVCFHEIVGVVPDDAELDPQLAALTAKLEELENLEQDVGPLRSILLDAQ